MFVSAGLIVEPRKEHSVIKSSCRPFGIKNSGILCSPFCPLQMTSASVDTTQVPKIVHIAREKLEEAGLPVTGPNLFECLSKSDWDRLSWTFKFYLCKDQEKLLIFKETKTDEECREMVAQFVLDPADFAARGINGEPRGVAQPIVDEFVLANADARAAMAF